jgi:MoaA/NifB/PqqE/SkfB family radical SAM enzyme
MPLGNIGRDAFERIWNGKPYRRLRRRVLHNPMGVYLCRNCVFRREVANSEIDYAKRGEIADQMPEILWIEPIVFCNLRCPGCGRELIAASRRRRIMPFETYKSALDQLGSGLRLLFFYDYGESFLHPRAVDMLTYARSVNETMLIHCSTNGIPLRDERKQREVIETGVDELLFSVDGSSQEVYERYRVGGDFEGVLKVMESMIGMRNSLGLDRPRIMWRYILFRWNDSDQEMDRARRLARDIGVDDFSWLLTTHPPEMCSCRFAPGSPELPKIDHELFRWQDPTIDPMYGT